LGPPLSDRIPWEEDAVKEKWLYGNAARVFGLE